MSKVKKAVIPAAGFGTRFLPFTKSVSKELILLVDKPVIQYVVEEAVASGIEDILIIISAGKEDIRRHFSNEEPLEERLRVTGKQKLLDEIQAIPKLANISYIYQEELNGLGGAIYCAKEFVGDEPFAVLLGDNVTSGERPVLSELLEVYEAKSSSAVALEEVDPAVVNRYGVIEAKSVEQNVYNLKNLVEKPDVDKAPSNLVIASRYVFTPQIMDKLAVTPRGKGNEIQLTDAMKLLLEAQDFYGVKICGQRHDIGDKLEFLCNTVEFGLRRPEFRDKFLKYLQEIVAKNNS